MFSVFDDEAKEALEIIVGELLEAVTTFTPVEAVVVVPRLEIQTQFPYRELFCIC